MKIHHLTLVVTLALCGCAYDPSGNNKDAKESASSLQQQESGKASLTAGNPNNVSTLEASASFQQQYKQKFIEQSLSSGYSNEINPKNHNINHYVRGIMQDLVSNLQYVSSETPMAVTSFVYLDSDLQQSSLLGNQIAESFIHEIHKFGIPIIDYKTTDYVRVTPSGAFVLSRDFLELPGNLPVKYVLVGTLAKHQGGVLVNARIVGMKSKAVVASAQGFLPSDITHSLIDTDANDGIKLISG